LVFLRVKVAGGDRREGGPSSFTLGIGRSTKTMRTFFVA